MQKKLFVFGGSGLGGKVLLAELEKTNVQVVAVTRNPQKAPKFKNVRWIKGDPKIKSTYIEQLKGSNAVISYLGSQDKKNVDIYSKGYPQIFSAMEEAGVLRIVIISASHDHPDTPFIFKHVIRPAFLSKVFEDMQIMDSWLKNYKGPVKYTNLRPMRFIEGKRKKFKVIESYVKENKGWQFETNVIDLAQTAIQCWQKDLYINKFAQIGNAQ